MRRQRPGGVAPPGPRRVLLCLGAVGLALAGQGALSSAAFADPTTGTSSPTVTVTSAGSTTPFGSPTGSASTAAPTTSATASTTPTTPSTGPSTPPPPPPGDGEDALTPAQVAAQVAQATRLRGALAQSDAALAALGRKLAEAAAQATSALQRARQAQLAEQAAATTLREQLSQLATLQAQAATSEVDMARWARNAYVAGGSLSSYQGWIGVLQGDVVGDVSHDLAVLEHLGVLNGEELDRLRTAAASQETVARRAAQTARAAAQAATEAQQAKKRADALMAQQRAVLTQVQAEQLKTIGSAVATRDHLARSTSADARAAAAQLDQALQSQRAGTPVPIDPAQCQGLSTAGYPNGEIPAAALCPLWGAPNQLARGDAARAFSALSRSYATVFGHPICVTDSYRSRSQQVTLYAAKPNLAARPGTSNHGWGTALDLCGGIESFGTAEHAWLLTHAPLYGWFHPSWAEPTGSRPEPWHWEYAG